MVLNYFTKAGVPVLGDPFEQVGKTADRVKVARTLWTETGRYTGKGHTNHALDRGW